MPTTNPSDLHSDFYHLFDPTTHAAKVLIPLLDALNWQGDNSKIMESISTEFDMMDIEALLETMANLRFQHQEFKKLNGLSLESHMLPVLFVTDTGFYLVLNIGDKQAFIYDTEQCLYLNIPLDTLHGTAYVFQHAEENKETLIHQQNNWFNKLIYRFKDSFKLMIGITFIMTLLDLLIPLFIIIVYNQISNASGAQTLSITYIGVLIYVGASYTLSHIRATLTNYISTRMGAIISLQTFTRLLYLSPSYTETASISAQINRIKDFENLKRFVTSGVFINIIELIFSAIYILTIFSIGGWIGVIPIVTLFLVIGLGYLMRPFHKIKMEKRVDSSSERQQNLIELLKNTDEIKISGQKQYWFERYKTITGENIYDTYNLGNYVNMSNSLSYFITNASVLMVIYGGVLQVFNGHMNIGSLIGVILLYWKILRSIRGAFSLSVQVNGLKKSIAQINRFMKLPQDSNLKTDMTASKTIQGHISFTDVSIRYNQTAKPALININFKAKPGQIIGLSGHDGAGKTTILKLILGMYKPHGGRILLDNINIKQLEPLKLRRSISYAPERDILFTGTIRENFRYFNPSISDSSINMLMLKTGLDDYMSFFGYTLDTEFTNKDIANASMAFKKLFNLTRLLTRDVQLYLIDEPENYLSQDELLKISNVIIELAKHKNATVIIASKEPKVLQSCDELLTLNQGKIQKPKRSKKERGKLDEEATSI